MICVAVTYVIQPGHDEDAVGLFRKLTEATRAEPGCRMYLAHRSTTDPRRLPTPDDRLPTPDYRLPTIWAPSAGRVANVLASRPVRFAYPRRTWSMKSSTSAAATSATAHPPNPAPVSLAP